MTKIKQFEVGEEVTVTNVEKLAFGERSFSEGEVTTVYAVDAGYGGMKGIELLAPNSEKDERDELSEDGVVLFYVMEKELQYIKKKGEA